MADQLDHLRLVQWLSPAFPIGGFAYSQGLEAAINDGLILDGDSLALWLQSVLRFGTGRMDAIFVAHALNPHTDIAALADLARAYAGSAERAQEMTEQGRAFGVTVAALLKEPQPPLPYAVALGYAARNLNLDTAVVLGLYLQAFAAQLTAAAVKFVPLGQTVGQKILTDLGPDLVRLATIYATTPLSGLGSASFGADLAQMRHETMDVRIFRS